MQGPSDTISPREQKQQLTMTHEHHITTFQRREDELLRDFSAEINKTKDDQVRDHEAAMEEFREEACRGQWLPTDSVNYRQVPLCKKRKMIQPGRPGRLSLRPRKRMEPPFLSHLHSLDRSRRPNSDSAQKCGEFSGS